MPKRGREAYGVADRSVHASSHATTFFLDMHRRRACDATALTHAARQVTAGRQSPPTPALEQGAAFAPMQPRRNRQPPPTIPSKKWQGAREEYGSRQRTFLRCCYPHHPGSGGDRGCHTRFQRQNQMQILHVRQDQNLHTCNDSVNTKRQCQNVKRVL